MIQMSVPMSIIIITRTPAIRVNINTLFLQELLIVYIALINFYPCILDTESHKRAELRITDISNFVSDDWINLAHELGFQTSDIAQIQREYPDSSGQQCMSMLNLWMNEISGQDSGIMIIC